MNKDATIIAALIGIGGILVTAIISSIGYLLKYQTEKKKSTRKVLYFLLEIRFSIITSLFDPDEATEEYITHYTDHLIKKGIPVSREEFSGSLTGHIKNHFLNIFDNAKTDIETRLLLPFESALLEMASIDPVTAYQIRGTEKLEKLIKHTGNYQTSTKDLYVDTIKEDWFRDVIIEAASEMKNDVLNELVTDLDNDVLKLAKACGWSDARKCKKAIKKGKTNKDKYSFRELDDVLDKIIIKVINAANSSPTSDATAK